VAVIGQVLVQFVFRLTFGMALAMALTPARLVTSGYYRVHLWVLMGLNTFAALALYSGREGLEHLAVSGTWLFSGAVLLAVLSYVGAVCWLYERPRAGRGALLLVAGLALLAALGGTPWGSRSSLAYPLMFLDVATAGWLIGVTLAAMLLGHWYLNTPTMQLFPLRRLVLWMMLAVVARGLVALAGLGFGWAHAETATALFLWMIGFRWLTGLLGALVMAILTWYTLQVPNTQSATGILYAGVILVFLGELMSQLLSMDAPFPL
jgi:hypothetical protein